MTDIIQKNLSSMYKSQQRLVKEYKSIYCSDSFRIGLKILSNPVLLWIWKKIRSSHSYYIDDAVVDKYDSNALIWNVSDFDWAPKVSIYTGIFGGYDKLIEQIFRADWLTYKLYTDLNYCESKKWDVLKLPQFVSGNLTSVLKNRMIKMHPHELFFDEEFAVYVDGNIRILNDIRPMLRITKCSKTGVGIHRHTVRKCLYAEANACIKAGKGNANKIKEQIVKYKNDGFPENYGLFEANVIVVDLLNPNAKRIMMNWWNEFNDSGSYRDQLALPYVLYKLGFVADDVADFGCAVVNNPFIAIHRHKNG